MSYEMQFSREFSPCGHWDIGYGHPLSVEQSDHPEEYLIEEVNTAIGQKPLMRCNGSVCKLIFDSEPSTEEKDEVTALVTTHKANADHTDPPFNEKSILFDGVDEYVSVGNVLNFDYDEPFSMHVWFKTTADGPIMLPISKREQYGNRRGYECRFRTDTDKFIFILCSVDGSSDINVQWTQSANEFNDGNWHLMLWTYDGSTNASGFKLYIDNVEKTLSVVDDTLDSTTITTQAFQLSGKYGSNFLWDGNLDEWGIWNKELSLAEGSEIWNSGKPADLSEHSAYANLKGWWRGDGDTFPTLTDNSSETNDGTMTNMEAGDIIEDVP